MQVPIRLFRETVPLYVLKLVPGTPVVLRTWYVISSTEPRAHCTSSIYSSSSANIRNIWSTCGRVFEILRSFILHDESSFCKTDTRIPVSVTVKRCRYHAIQGSVGCTWYVSYEYGRYRTLHIYTYGTAVLVPKCARIL